VLLFKTQPAHCRIAIGKGMQPTASLIYGYRI